MIKIYDEKIKTNGSKPYGSIYLATNITNRKVYVGKVKYPKTIEERWNEHLQEGRNLRKIRNLQPNKKIWDTHLNNAIAKYGENIWTLECLGLAYTKEEINQKERNWIKKI
jgi:hypothetical protein